MSMPVLWPIVCGSLVFCLEAPLDSIDTLVFNARVGEERTEFTNHEILAATYSGYRVPQGFYRDEMRDDESVGYLNTISIRSKEKARGRVELCTSDWNEARRWQQISDSNSFQQRILLGENETDKYFEFRTGSYSHPSHIHLMRVHKCRYLDRSGFDPRAHYPIQDFTGWFQGTANVRPVTAEIVQELGEYLWLVGNHQAEGARVLSSFSKIVQNEICHTMYALWKSVHAQNALSIDKEARTKSEEYRELADLNLVRLDYHVDQKSGRITLDSEKIRTVRVRSNPPELLAE